MDIKNCNCICDQYTELKQKQREKDFYEGSDCVLCTKQIEAEQRQECWKDICVTQDELAKGEFWINLSKKWGIK